MRRSHSASAAFVHLQMLPYIFGESKMTISPKRRLKIKLKKLFILLSGALFAVYSLYNVFLIARDGKAMGWDDIAITAVVALLFAVFGFFAWTAEIRDIWFHKKRRVVFIVAFIAVLLLKLRMFVKVVDFLDVAYPYTIIYGCSYCATLAGMLVLFVYYAFIRKRVPPYPRAPKVLTVCSMAFFAAALVLDGILYFVFDVIVEANVVRTLVMRPIFYLGFICVGAYFLFPPLSYDPYAGAFVLPDDDEEYVPPEGSVPIDYSQNELVSVDEDEEYIPPEGSVPIDYSQNELVSVDEDEEYIPPEGSVPIEYGKNELVSVDEDEEYVPPEGSVPIDYSQNELVSVDEDEEYVPPEGSVPLEYDGTEFVTFDDYDEYDTPLDPGYADDAGTDLVSDDGEYT